MAKLTLEQAAAIVDEAIRTGRDRAMNPLTVSVVDDGGHLKAFKREDGPGAALRPQVATGKAFGAVGMGRSSRALGAMGRRAPAFRRRPVRRRPGTPRAGPRRRLDQGRRRGHWRGRRQRRYRDTSDNDEIAAVAGIEAAGLNAGI